MINLCRSTQDLFLIWYFWPFFSSWAQLFIVLIIGDLKKQQLEVAVANLIQRTNFFLVLVKLRLNLKLTDLAFRFGVSTSVVSRYITTWICFLYHHLKELEWMPSVNQVRGTLPTIFREKFPTTYAIIDGSEVFMETPSDLALQSSTWSQYKHHNTVKFLVACTPNGAFVLYFQFM